MSYNPSVIDTSISDLKPIKRSLWGRIKHHVLNYKLSNRIKRLIFLSSFFGYIKRDDGLSIETMVKLNSVLTLAHNVNAMEFPILIRTWLWDHELEEGIKLGDRYIVLSEFYKNTFSRSDFDGIADFLISKAPSWMIYGPRETISKDLECLHLCNEM